MTLPLDGALRRTNRHASREPIDAQRLVAETLARHGISVDLPAGLTKGLPSGLPTGLPKGLPMGIDLPGQMPSVETDRETFACAAGTRDYVVHVPEGEIRGLILMLHGCKQTPEDFAAGTNMNAIADANGLVVVWPAQNRGANAQSCWNWFSPGDQRRDRGEPAILAGMVREIARRHDVPAGRIFVAGLSAGAAMAVILGQTHGELFAGVGAHSGLPYGCARSVPEAFSAMAGNSEHAASITHAVPTIVFHGDADATVKPANSDRISAEAAVGTQLTTLIDDGTTNGRTWRRSGLFSPSGNVVGEDWRVAGLGHAWSGGDQRGSYADPAGPDASAEMVRFFMALPLLNETKTEETA